MDEIQFNLAWQAYRQGNTSAAQSRLCELLAQSPNEPMYHGLLAACLMQQHRLTAAQYELSIALHGEPNNAFLLNRQASLHILQREYQLAIDTCQHMLQLDPMDISALLLLADIYQTTENYDQQLSYVQQAHALEPNDIDVLLAYADYFINIKDLNTAKQYALDAIKIDPSALNANLAVANIDLKLGNIESAENHTKFVMTYAPDSKACLQIFAAIKAIKNPLLGLWWKANNFLDNLSQLRMVLVLISGYLMFNLAAQILRDLDQPSYATVVSSAWLLIVIYSWVGIPLYHKMLKKELADFKFNPNY
ncbi:tetratricopeptide repeat protein [Catenovulum agarivorans]|uniref:tetratricopeptide repeat protein n=1 Tax=Catenovulum agarivorans TaxID=1172192 RepID=UPI0002F04EF7|nr:hypothetical protein [Catenovulum agarivorans]